MSVHWPGKRDRTKLHVVTGKGGTGKSTVAAALALALAASGKDVLVCEVEGRQGLAQLFDVPPLPYAEQQVATGVSEEGERTGSVYALHIDAESALLEYLSMYYKLGRAGKALDRFGVIDFATTVAPGVRDVLLTGKIYEATKTGRKGRNVRDYDAVVLDAPPTGRITRFLGTNSEVAGLARMGPIKNQADNVHALFTSPRTAVHLVTVLEEMPVQETADGIAELRHAGFRVGGVFVNLARPQDIGGDDLAVAINGDLDRRRTATDLAKAGIDVTDTLVDGLVEEAQQHAERRALEDVQRGRVAELDASVFELPLLAGGVDLGGLYELADTLRQEGIS